MSVHFELNDGFFRDETKDGFQVPGLMKRCWGAQLRVLEAFDAICEAHGLRWFAFVGTLLGAVRHKGFIPWDDDVDIAMPREDYEKFLSFAPAELPFGYQIINYDEKDHEYDCITRVNNTRGIIFDVKKAEDFCGFPYPAGLDLYPLDFIVEDPDERKAHIDLHYKIQQATELCRKLLSGSGPLADKDGKHLEPAEVLAELSMITGYEFDLGKDIIRQLIENSNRSMEIMTEVKEIIEQQTEYVDETRQIFGQVESEIDSSLSGIDEITDTIDKLDRVRETVVGVVDNLSGIAENNAASTEETSASTSVVSTMMGEVSDIAGKISEIAIDVQKDVDVFTVKDQT